MKICLFDWNAGGHHNFYARAFAEALSGQAEVVIAGPDLLLREIANPSVETYSLGEPRPRPVKENGHDKASLAAVEIDLLRSTIADTKPDQAVVLFADPIMRWLARTEAFPCRISAFIMFATAHYPRAYSLPLTPKERLSAGFKEWNIRRWRRRADAQVLFGLDAEAVKRWNQSPGAPARWVPEPPLEVVPQARTAAEKSGCFLFGYFDERKGMDRLAAALGEGCDGLELSLFGDVAPEYRKRLEAELAVLEQGGIRLNTDFRRVPYDQAMEQMSRSRCALLSFGWRPAGSRVLLEAAAARTPVVTGSGTAIAKLVDRHGLGLTADPGDPEALRKAILSIALDPAAPEHYEAGLRHYAEELHGSRFGGEVREALGLPKGS